MAVVSSCFEVLTSNKSENTSQLNKNQLNTFGYLIITYRFYHESDDTGHVFGANINNRVIRYFLMLNTKREKISYNLSTDNNKTEVFLSIGMLLKYLETFKKSMKKSVKAHVMLIKFIKNTINRLLLGSFYIFVMRGLNFKIFKLLHLFSSCFEV
jgi:hypothetical protein